MFEDVVLAFLSEKSMTGYEIKRHMMNSTHYFYNTSFGNIYPTLNKLEKSGYVTCSDEIINGKLNKTYTITASGKMKFMSWLEMDSPIGMIRDEAYTKMLFFLNLDNRKQKEKIQSYLEKITEQIEVIKKIKYNHKDEMDTWKIKTIDFGIDYYIFLKKSYQKILNEL